MDKELPLSLRCGGLIAAQGVRAWMRTMEYRALYYDRALDPMYGCDQPRIYVFWHEYILVPLYLRGHCDVAMLLSKHRDADILARVAAHLGFDCVRGSTNRGATAALMDLSRRGRYMHLAITPDGPRGPRRKLAVGPIYLASRLGLPIVPLGFGIDRPWRMKSWDRFALPKPFSQIRGIVGPEVNVPDNLDREQLDQYRLGLENLLNDLTTEAENWASSGKRRQGEITINANPRVLSHGHLAASSQESATPLLDDSIAEESTPPLRLSA